MKLSRIIVVVVVIALLIVPLLLRVGRERHLTKQVNDTSGYVHIPPAQSIPPAPSVANVDTSIIRDSSKTVASTNEVSSPVTGNLRPLPPKTKDRGSFIITNILSLLLGFLVIFWVVKKFIIKKKPKNYGYKPQTSYNPTPPVTPEILTITAIRGGMGEPYCSDHCYNEGGQYASAVMLKNQTGVCGFCQNPVQASMYGTPNCAIIPYEGVNLFICTNCTTKAKTFLRTYKKCCMCQKDLTKPVTTPAPKQPAEPRRAELMKKIISEKGLRPLGNRKRLAPLSSEDEYNVRMLLFRDRENASKYYRLIIEYAEKTPPPVFLEVILLYIPKNIYAEKYGVVVPNEYTDKREEYKSWYRDCILTCNDTLRVQQPTDHKYKELHNYVECVYEWTILTPQKFAGEAADFADILVDVEEGSFPALKMFADKGVTATPEKPNPLGEWIGVLFDISKFDEVSYGRASIKLLTETVGKEQLADTVVHGGDMLPDAIYWCVAIHTNSSGQLNYIGKAIKDSGDSRLAPMEKRIMTFPDPSKYMLPYQGFFGKNGEYVGSY